MHHAMDHAADQRVTSGLKLQVEQANTNCFRANLALISWLLLVKLCKLGLCTGKVCLISILDAQLLFIIIIDSVWLVWP